MIKRALVILSILILIGIATDYVPKEIYGYPAIYLPIGLLGIVLFISLSRLFPRCM